MLLKFVSLAPTANADESGVYSRALQFAITQRDVLNIALTGPYGSGKSSVIETFLADYPKRRTLRLSLAAFAPDGGASVTDAKAPEIERSLLQQILYGVEAGKLPFSRFKRIQTPKRWSPATSFLLLLGAVCAWYVFSKQTDILSGSFFEPVAWSNWLHFAFIGVTAAVAWRLIHRIYTNSFGLSLKSISLKDVQITSDAADETSLLNRHFDEILYFFQSTKYDLVVIEDLDRFDDHDIFVKLREINGLINSNEGIKRPVRFLYALRDDIFANKDRTKFFEFIIPVIPIINHSNSIDKVWERSQSLNLSAKLDKRFLRDVSRHLTDLRLIHNIFNEYVVYADTLDQSEDRLETNKLLAILIYKNVFPGDFAALHHQQGILATVISRYEEYISRSEAAIRAEMASIEADLENGEAQFLRSQSELRMVYAMAIIARMPGSPTSLQSPNGDVPVRQLAESDELDGWVSSGSPAVVRDVYGSRTSVDLKGLERSVDPTRTFAERKADIDHKSAKFRQDAHARLRELKSGLASLRTRKFNEVLRASAELIDEAFVGVGESSDLLRFLILEGYLDDTYYQYISLFHSGRLSHNDNRFLIQIRAYKLPNPDFQIDNAAEVVASMRPDDFGHNYVLNRFVVDHLLESPATYSVQLTAMSHFMATRFEECGDFFLAYYARGAQVRRLVEVLANGWADFPIVAVKASGAASHAARLLAFAPETQLALTGYAGSALAEFVSTNTRDVLSEGVEFELSRIRTLEVLVTDVSSISEFSDACHFVVENGMYRVTAENIDYIFRQSVGPNDAINLTTRHFSTLLSANNVALLKRVESDFQTYVSDVLLKLESNTDEDLDAITKVLRHDEVDHDALEQFLRRQTAIFPSFDGVPESFRAVVLQEQRIDATWENCLAFMHSEAYSPELLTEFLIGTQTALAAQSVPLSEQAAPLREFLLENDDLPQDIYRSYVRQLPMPFPQFPNVSAAKFRILIEERRVLFTPENFDSLNDVTLQVLFIATNFNRYLADEEAFSLDDDFRAQLLSTTITDVQKLKILDDMKNGYVANNSAVAAAAGQILFRSSISDYQYDTAFIRAVIVHSRPVRVQIALLNKFHSSLSRPEIRSILSVLPKPFRDIAEFGRSPKLEDDGANRALATWLKDRRLISSFSDAGVGGGLRIYTFKGPN